ncbi:hypothetical protein KQY10_07785 [Leptospira interrogans]|uniref:Uncharacterized protein n=3 Tax=Leptospira interrogans TaxID=173 RepID=A0A0F6HAT4_LEPIR|nr:hypothetical protein [Leptospira interrogans]EMF42714.1 hypothetical protein LEP1GSC067_4362 [Leptospira interrogans serovar Lora str. TE 1992]EMF73116.1 hypothetical protein LEP1GSC148_2075 [Leptospira interrogans serovar Canicola str. LT1962]AKH78202.1 hypothetical protein BRAT_14870 [Leptospira interrogans serovar Bratislava]ALE38221.1 hypothetical protein G436_1010 [Leptospira interrogans serovar Hardjo str. Norma]EKO25390.1 hypothetical protein LEP1GSC104_3736 [Leptospira interrogans s
MRTFLSGLFWSRFQPIWLTRLVGQGEIRSYGIGKKYFLKTIIYNDDIWNSMFYEFLVSLRSNQKLVQST